jgi:hypothetical protein
MEPLEFTVSQQFEIERFNRVIESTSDVDSLRKLAKQLLQAWYIQKAATTWVMKENLNSQTTF